MAFIQILMFLWISKMITKLIIKTIPYTIKQTPTDKTIAPITFGLFIFSLKNIFPKKTELSCPTDLLIDSIIGTQFVKIA